MCLPNGRALWWLHSCRFCSKAGTESPYLHRPCLYTSCMRWLPVGCSLLRFRRLTVFQRLVCPLRSWETCCRRRKKQIRLRLRTEDLSGNSTDWKMESCHTAGLMKGLLNVYRKACSRSWRFRLWSILLCRRPTSCDRSWRNRIHCPIIPSFQKLKEMS